MAKIGQAFTKENVMDFATELIEVTEHAIEFKKKRNLRTKDDGEKVIIGDRWYNGFMKRKKGSIKAGSF
jgi:hypothetical protein